MPNTIRNVFYKNLTFEKLYQAHLRARKGKAQKLEIIKFELNLENNIINLLNNIKNNTYKVGKYFSFVVYEPKERIIDSLPYVDRIVHQWYIEEFIKPYIVPKLISHTYACITNRGTHSAVSEVQRQLQIFKRNNGDNFYILKCDIKKFFLNISPRILFTILSKYISDKKLLDFTKILISNNTELDVGIPIGNYTSQFFANIYLNELDQYIKHTL